VRPLHVIGMGILQGEIKMRHLIVCLILASFAVVHFPAHAEDAELDAEQAIGDSEAAKGLAQETKTRIAHEKREAAASEREAVRLKAKADRKQKFASEELARNEVTLRDLDKRIKAAKGNIDQANQRIAASEQALAKKKIQLDSAREQLKIAGEELKKRSHHIGELQDQLASKHNEIEGANRDIGSARADFKRRGLDEQRAQSELNTAIKDSMDVQARKEGEMSRLKAQYQKQKAATQTIKTKLSTQKDHEKQAGENVDWAKQQTAKVAKTGG
jgi:colicin import membrane protein